MKTTQFLFGTAAVLSLFSGVLAAGGTPPPHSKHWGLECHSPAKRETCKNVLVQCDGKHADWKIGAPTVCHNNCNCVEHGGTPPPPYGKDHPPQHPPIRPVSPLNLNGKKPNGKKGKRDAMADAYYRRYYY